MDVGKSLCCLYGKQIPSEHALRTMIQEKAFQTPQAKWIGVPTTAGTGSEVTCWATIWDPSKDAKRSLESQQNYAFAAVADPDLIRQMPLSLAVSSALDAVAHAVESCWARNTNPVSRALALSAVRTIMSQMDSLLAGDRTACDSMSRGSSWQGSPSAIPEPRPVTPFPIRSPCITGFHTERRSAFFWLPFSGSTGKTRSGRRTFFRLWA